MQPIFIYNDNERYTIQRYDGAWWQGHHWESNRLRAIGLHGVETLMAEIERYFAGYSAQYVIGGNTHDKG